MTLEQNHPRKPVAGESVKSTLCRRLTKKSCMIIHGPVGKNISLPPDSSLLGHIYPLNKGILLSGLEEEGMFHSVV